MVLWTSCAIMHRKAINTSLLSGLVPRLTVLSGGRIWLHGSVRPRHNRTEEPLRGVSRRRHFRCRRAPTTSSAGHSEDRRRLTGFLHCYSSSSPLMSPQCAWLLLVATPQLTYSLFTIICNRCQLSDCQSTIIN